MSFHTTRVFDGSIPALFTVRRRRCRGPGSSCARRSAVTLKRGCRAEPLERKYYVGRSTVATGVGLARTAEERPSAPKLTPPDAALSQVMR